MKDFSGSLYRIVVVLCILGGFSCQFSTWPTQQQNQAAYGIEVQRADNWCWASCIQSAVRQAGNYRTQEEIVARLTGWPQNRPASTQEVAMLLNSYNLRSWVVPYPGSPQQLNSTLAGGWKLIAFVRPYNGPVGHFILLEGVDGWGNIVISDPATGMTYRASPQTLYDAWRWSGSIVVGR